MSTRKVRWFWPVLLTLLLTDCATKRLASERLVEHQPLPVVGDVVRLTLAHNPYAAMGISLGRYSRVGFGILAAAAVVVLIRMYRAAPAGDATLAAGLALVAGGALGNLIDRVRSTRGVVDFIDIGVGEHRFWIFNVADIGVTVGAITLAVLFWIRGETNNAPRTG
jgi:signal peptidase II